MQPPPPLMNVPATPNTAPIQYESGYNGGNIGTGSIGGGGFAGTTTLPPAYGGSGFIPNGPTGTGIFSQPTPPPSGLFTQTSSAPPASGPFASSGIPASPPVLNNGAAPPPHVHPHRPRPHPTTAQRPARAHARRGPGGSERAPSAGADLSLIRARPEN